MPSSRLGAFFRVPFSDPLWSPQQRKKGTCKKPATKQREKNKRLQCKQHFNTFTTFGAHALQCLLDVWNSFSRCPLLTPFITKAKKKWHLQKPATKHRKNNRLQLNNTSKHLPSLELMPCNVFFMYLENLFKVPFSDPLWSPQQRKKRAPAKTCNKTKRKKQKATVQTTL